MELKELAKIITKNYENIENIIKKLPYSFSSTIF